MREKKEKMKYDKKKNSRTKSESNAKQEIQRVISPSTDGKDAKDLQARDEEQRESTSGAEDIYRYHRIRAFFDKAGSPAFLSGFVKRRKYDRGGHPTKCQTNHGCKRRTGRRSKGCERPKTRG